MFMTGLNLSRLGLSPNEIEAELFALVGGEPHMRKKNSRRDKILGEVWSPEGGSLRRCVKIGTMNGNACYTCRFGVRVMEHVPFV